MANPWLIGLGVLSVGVVGMMLMGHKSSTAAPDRMPDLNSAIRGKPVPVTFGTNRVYPQITWTNNYNVVQQSGGKKGGKGGGSGGFGSAKGGNTGAGYLYYWDMLFEFGQVDLPVTLRRGWIGGDRIDDRIMSLLTTGGSQIMNDLFVFLDALDKTQKIATLDYTECFLYPGYVTGDSNLTSWTYFNTTVGYPCAFPSTCALGFKQLKLGQTPAVPQLSVEVVPLNAIPEYSGAGHFLSKNAIYNPPVNAPYVEADTLYEVVNQTPVLIYNIFTATQIASISQSSVDTSLKGIGLLGMDVIKGAFAIDGTNYFYIVGRKGVGAILYMVAACYSITNGVVTFEGGGEYNTGTSLVPPFANPTCAGVLSTGEVCVGYVDFQSVNINFMVYHAPAVFAGGGSISVTAGSRWQAIAEIGAASGYSYSGSYGNSPSSRLEWGIVQDALVTYVSRNDMDWHAARSGGVSFNGYIKSVQPANPNGALIAIDIASNGAGTVVYTFEGVNNTFLRNGDGTAAVPFSDAGTGDIYSDYMAPTQVGNFIYLARNYNDSQYQAGVRVYYRNPLTGERRQVSGLTRGTFANSSNYADAHAIAMSVYEQQGDLYVRTGVSSSYIVNATFGAALENSVDVTPAYVIYRILTSDMFGFSTQAAFGFTITTDRVDATSYQAAHDYCRAQGIYISVTYDNQQNLLDIIKELLDLYQGFLTVEGGIIKFGYVDGSLAPIRTIDNHHLVPDEVGKPPVQTTKAALEDGYNKIQFNYLDRSIDYDQNQVEVEDPVDQDINGPRIKTYNTKFVMNGSVAMTIAKRALWANLYGTDTYAFQLGWKDADLAVGDQITLVDSFDDILKSGVTARLTKWAPVRRGVFKVEARREFPYILQDSADFTSVTSVDAGWSTLIDTPTPMQMQTAYELPREFQGSKAHVYFGYAQASRVMGAKFYLSTGGSYVEAADVQPFILSGRIGQDLPVRNKGYVETDFQFYLFTSSFNTSTITFCQTLAMDDVPASDRAAGAGILIVGSEAVSIENLTQLGQNHYKAKYAYRGWGGSPIAAHTSGDFFHRHGSGVFAQEISTDKIGTTFSYKIAGYDFAGRVYDVSSIAAQSYEIRGDYWLPRQQPCTRVFVDSALSWPNSTMFQGQYIAVVSGGCNVNLTWPLADNAEGYGATGYGAGTYGHFIMADSTSWRIDIASANGTKVSSFFVNTNAFTYNRAQNSADFSGFAHDLIYTVTPYNTYGDGPVNDVRSLSLIW